jgi:hypothetical protein
MNVELRRRSTGFSGEVVRAANDNARAHPVTFQSCADTAARGCQNSNISDTTAQVEARMGQNHRPSLRAAS